MDEPHDHRANGWGAFDVLWDCAAWWNPFSAVPTGARDIAPRETLIETRSLGFARTKAPAPLAGRRVELLVDGAVRGERASDAEGIVRFDVRSLLKRTDADADRKLTVRLKDAKAGQAPITRALTADEVRRMLGMDD